MSVQKYLKIGYLDYILLHFNLALYYKIVFKCIQIVYKTKYKIVFTLLQNCIQIYLDSLSVQEVNMKFSAENLRNNQRKMGEIKVQLKNSSNFKEKHFEK